MPSGRGELGVILQMLNDCGKSSSVIIGDSFERRIGNRDILQYIVYAAAVEECKSGHAKRRMLIYFAEKRVADAHISGKGDVGDERFGVKWQTCSR